MTGIDQLVFRVDLAPYNDGNVHSWPAGRTMDWHGHSFWQTIHVLQGVLEVDTGAGWLPVEAGQVHVLPPGNRHRLQTREGHWQLGLNFRDNPDERGFIQALAEACPTPTVLPYPLANEQVNEIRSLAATPRERLALGWALDGYVLGLLKALTRQDQRHEKLLAYLHDEAAGAVRVEEMARHMGMSRAGLQRFCQERFGCGASALHDRLRLGRAARLLLAPDLRVTECAERCGYPDIYTFSRAFKRVHGLSPREFREAHGASLG